MTVKEEIETGIYDSRKTAWMFEDMTRKLIEEAMARDAGYTAPDTVREIRECVRVLYNL